MSAHLVAARRSGRWGTVLAVAGLMLALFLVALDQTVVGTALPKIVAELNGFERCGWVTTAYLLASTSMIPVIGKLGDIYGRKWFIVGGIVVFLARDEDSQRVLTDTARLHPKGIGREDRVSHPRV
jgi:MFS family permease